MNKVLDFLGLLLIVLVALAGASLLLGSDDPHQWFIGLGCLLGIIASRLVRLVDLTLHQTKQLQYLVEVAAETAGDS